MGYIIFHVLITIFAVVGFIETTYALGTSLFSYKKGKTILILSPDTDNIEFLLRSCTAKSRWPGKIKPDKIYCIKDHLSEEAKEISRIFCKENGLIEMKGKDELTDLISIL